MALYNPNCLGYYDFDNIARFARLRFIEGKSTIQLLSAAQSEKEKEEIALVAILDLEDDDIKHIKLHCKHAKNCQVTTCRQVIRSLIRDQQAA